MFPNLGGKDGIEALLDQLAAGFPGEYRTWEVPSAAVRGSMWGGGLTGRGRMVSGAGSRTRRVPVTSGRSRTAPYPICRD